MPPDQPPEALSLPGSSPGTPARGAPRAPARAPAIDIQAGDAPIVSSPIMSSLGGEALGVDQIGGPAGLPGSGGATPDRASIGLTRTLALISAGILGTAVIVGLPV